MSHLYPMYNFYCYYHHCHHQIKGKWVAWHPEVATQLCLASEDDHSPHIQLWDLRFATSPLKSFESHTKLVSYSSLMTHRLKP